MIKVSIVLVHSGLLCLCERICSPAAGISYAYAVNQGMCRDN